MAQLLAITIVALAIIVAILVGGEMFTLRRYGFDTVGALDGAWRTALLAVSTYLGILGQVLATRLKQRERRRVSIVTEFKEACVTSDFWLAIIASPLVLFAAYGAVSQVSSVVLIATIGFQNGYFFHSILARQHQAVSEKP